MDKIVFMFSIAWPGQLSYSYQSCFSKAETEPKRGDVTCWRWHAQCAVDRRSELLSSDSSTCAHCAGTFPPKTWLHNTCMKVAGCHTLFMEVYVMVLVIWTYLCMKGKKILYPWVWSCSFIERHKAPACQWFSFLTKLTVCLWSWAWSNFRDTYSFQILCWYILTRGMQIARFFIWTHRTGTPGGNNLIPFLFFLPWTSCTTSCIFKISDLQGYNRKTHSCVNGGVYVSLRMQMWNPWVSIYLSR